MDSRLFVAVSPFVGGAGGHGRALAGGGSGGEARLDADVERFIPSVVIDTGRLAVLNDPLRSGTSPLGAGGAVPPGIRGSGTPSGTAGGGTTEGAAAGGGDEATVPVGNREVLRGRLDALTQQAEVANQNLSNAQAGAQEALDNLNTIQQDIEGQQATVESLEQAQTAAAEALAAAEASGDAAAIQSARDDLTRAQRSAQEARARLTGMFEHLANAQATLDQAQNALIAADQQAHDLSQQIAQTQRALEHSPGGVVPPSTPEQQADLKAKEQALKDAEAGFAEAQATAIAAHAAYETAQADLEAARAAFEATPSDLNRYAFEQAELAFQKAAEEYSGRMDAAREARNAVLELTALLRQLQIAPR
jgi:chromosome segregation ATPase